MGGCTNFLIAPWRQLANIRYLLFVDERTARKRRRRAVRLSEWVGGTGSKIGSRRHARGSLSG